MKINIPDVADPDVFTDEEIERLAATHMEQMRLLMLAYSSIYVEGAKRGLKSFSPSNIKLLSDVEQIPVADYLRSLNSKELLNAVHRYKDMPTCFKLTLAEIRRRLGDIP